MNHSHRIPFLFAAAALAAAAVAQDAPAPRPAQPQDGVSLTVYSSADPASFDPEQFLQQARGGANLGQRVPGFGVVKEVRTLALQQGLNDLRFTDVAQFLDPTTVSFADLANPLGTAVLEQNFQFDLVSADKVLQKYVDRPITVMLRSGTAKEEIAGTLLSVSGNELVLMTQNGLRVVPRHGQELQLGQLPGGLISRPTLVWKVRAAEAGERRVRTTYQTAGLTWRADYTLVLAAGETQADIGAWVTLLNLCGMGFPNAQLKLIAGDVQRVQPATRGRAERAKALAAAEMDAGGFQEKSFFEYHLYTLPRRTDVLANTSQQLVLFPTARGAKVEKILVYYGLPDARFWTFATPSIDRDLGSQANKKVDVYVRFDNKKDHNLGMPLPAGKVRVFKQDDADGTLEFIGEDLIDHTPKDERVLIKLGQSFDVVGDRVQTDFKVDSRAHWLQESYRIELRNRKDAPVRVLVKENLYRWNNWEITQKSDEFTKVDSRTVHFEIEVKANETRHLTYTVRYTW